MLRGIESCAILLFISICVVFKLNLIINGSWIALLWGFVALPIAYFLADLLSGLIHWVCDSFGSAVTPIWGPMLVKPFRIHHQNPLAITEISIIENLGSSAIAGCIIFFIWLGFIEWNERFTHSQLFSYWLGIWFLFFSFISNLFHRWSHLPVRKKPEWLKFLQKYQLILDSESHSIHHRKPHRNNYCILCGWANVLTNRVPWDRVEKGMSYLGIKTNFD